jgi:hypothetical protein
LANNAFKHAAEEEKRSIGMRRTCRFIRQLTNSRDLPIRHRESL